VSNTNDGGPAFPHVSRWVQEFSDEGKCIGCWPSGGGAGMTLRDWFAGQALVGICARTQGVYVWGRSKDKSAAASSSGTINPFFDAMFDHATDERREEGTLFHVKAAYEYADAMIAARGGGK